MADFTTTRLLQRIRKRAGLATWDEGMDAELLERANDEQRLYLTALLSGAKAQYKQATLDIAVTSALRYPIPARAIAANLKMIEGVDASGNRWFLAELSDRDFTNGWLNYRCGSFYVEGNELVFFRQPTQGTLRVTYDRRLSELVQTSAVGIITGIAGGSVTINPVPSGFGTAAASYDFVRATPHFDLLAMDKSATRASGVLTFAASDVPSGLAIGDRVCLAGQTDVCQAPLELHVLLAQQTAFSYLDDKGDDMASSAERRRNKEEVDVKRLIAERVQEGKLLVNRNGPGFGSARGWRRSSGVLP